MIEITYTIQILSPIRVGTGIGRAGYLDNTVVRDAYGQPYIPGSSIKGKVRAAFFRYAEALGIATHASSNEPAGCLADGAAPCDICRLFGAPQHPGQLTWRNAELIQDLALFVGNLDNQARRDHLKPKAAMAFGQQVRTNVSLDRKTQTSLPDHLFTAESVGDPVIFMGQVQGKGSCQDAARLKVVLESITHLGSARGRGLGRVEIEVTEVRCDGTSILEKIPKLLTEEGAK